jgi:hypothetical protein
MLSSSEVERVVQKAALAHLPVGQVRRVMVEPYVNYLDEVGLKITIVLPDGDVLPVSGDAALETLLAISDDLDAAGETRSPNVWYTTEREMAEIGNPVT